MRTGNTPPHSRGGGERMALPPTKHRWATGSAGHSDQEQQSGGHSGAPPFRGEGAAVPGIRIILIPPACINGMVPMSGLYVAFNHPQTEGGTGDGMHFYRPPTLEATAGERGDPPRPRARYAGTVLGSSDASTWRHRSSMHIIHNNIGVTPRTVVARQSSGREAPPVEEVTLRNSLD